MPVYNAAPFVAEAIRSVLNQNFNDFELIIINDGSTDASEEQILAFKDKRILYLKQSNQGQVIASNNGIKRAQGRFIKFLDADDIINKDHLLLQYNAIKNDIGCIASCEWAVFYKDISKAVFQKENVHRHYNNPMDWFYDAHYYDKGMLGAWLWLIPSSVLKKAGLWHPQLSLNNDFDFSTRLICASKGIRFAKGAKLYYRTGNQKSLTHSKNEQAYRSALLTTELAMVNILKIENSQRMRQLFADRFQAWIYLMYPQHKSIRKTMRSHIKDLGGSALKPEGGRLFKLLNLIFPWQVVKWTQFMVHKTIWRPILTLKYKRKMRKKFLL
jgi:glycosyltransferase involved in cell wall biosynthesis